MKKEEHLHKIYNTLLQYQKDLNTKSVQSINQLKQSPGMEQMGNALDTFNIKLTMVANHSMLALLEYILDDKASIDRIQNMAEEVQQLFMSEN